MSDNKQEIQRSNKVSFKEPPLPKIEFNHLDYYDWFGSPFDLGMVV